MAASSGKKSSRSKKSRSSSARSSKSSKSSLWRQIKTIGISIIVVYWLASCFTFGVSDFEIFDEGHWVTAKARAEKVAAFIAEHPEAFIMDVWGFGDRTKINPVIASADSGVRVWCINSHEVTKTAAEAAQKLCKTTKSGPTTIAIYGGNFANVDFSTNTSGSGSLELTVQQWGKNKFLELPETFARFRRVEIAPHAGVPDLSQATSLRNTFQHVKDFQGDVSLWDVSHVTDFSGLFHDSGFHGDISKWNPKTATNMSMMFDHAEWFDSDISRWDMRRVTSIHNMFDNVGLSPTHVTAIIEGWATNLPHDVTLSSNTLYYCGKPKELPTFKTKMAGNLGSVAQAPDCHPPRVNVVEQTAPNQPISETMVVRLLSDKTLRRWGDECTAVPHTATEPKELECHVTTPGEHTIWVKDYYNNTATVAVMIQNIAPTSPDAYRRA